MYSENEPLVNDISVERCGKNCGFLRTKGAKFQSISVRPKKIISEENDESKEVVIFTMKNTKICKFSVTEENFSFFPISKLTRKTYENAFLDSAKLKTKGALNVRGSLF